MHIAEALGVLHASPSLCTPKQQLTCLRPTTTCALFTQTAARMVTQWSNVLYVRLDEVAQQLAELSQSALLQLQLPHLVLPAWFAPSGVALPQSVDTAAWLAGTFATPAGLWTLAWVALAAWVLVVAGGQLERRREAAISRNRGGSESEADGDVGSSGSQGASGRVGSGLPVFRRPEVPLLAATCALLLRLSMVPIESLGGVGVDIYRPAAVVLTCATTFIALAAAVKVMMANLARPKASLSELVAAVKGVVVWHRALLLLDLLLALIAVPLAVKGQLLIWFGLYGLSVEWFTQRAEKLSEKLQ